MAGAEVDNLPPSSFAALKTDQGAAPAIDFKNKPAPSTPEEWIQRAHDVAAILAPGASDRERDNVVPHEQVQLLKDSGLLTAIGPAKYGGGGQTLETGYKLQRAVSAGDGSIGQLLGYHYLWTLTAQVVGSKEQLEAESKRWTEGKFFIGGAVNPRDSDLSITESEDKKSIIFNGRKAFSTGSKISDLTVLEGVIKGTDLHVFAIVDSKQPGIKYGDDWKDVLGLRGSQSGSIVIENVTVPWSTALGYNEKHEFVPLGAYNTVLLPAIQNIFANLYLGIAQGALAKAAKYTKVNTRPWPFTPDVKQKATEEFYIQEIYGTLQAEVWGVEAQLDQSGKYIQGLLGVNVDDRASVTEQQRGEAAVRVAAGKVRAVDVGLEVTSKIYEVLGARAISHKAGFDHFWKNLRTHTLHDPIAHKRAEVGRLVLTGEYPAATWYT